MDRRPPASARESADPRSVCVESAAIAHGVMCAT